MRITIKRIYDDPAPEDGVRVLIDRLWPRGVSKDAAALDEWAKDATPSDELRTWFHEESEGEDRYPEFRRRYLEELNGAPDAVDGLVERLRRGESLTLLTAAKAPARSHAPVLVEYLERVAGS